MTWEFVQEATAIAVSILVLSRICDFVLDRYQTRKRQS